MTGDTFATSERDRVRDATDLVRLIGEHIVLRPAGREHLGLCPFHQDRKPSFSVVTHKGAGFYKCFACGAAGDCFTFMMQFHRMTFGEALRALAQRAGIELTQRRSGPGSGAAADEVEARDSVGRINRVALTQFQRWLSDGQLGAAARNEIARRGFSSECVSRFSLGAAPPGHDNLHAILRPRATAVAAAIRAGLLRDRDGRTYDTFRNRLIFPIANELGTPIAFGGRALGEDEMPKYLNSPENALFSKSKTLYALHLAKQAIIRSGRAIVAEGYTDVIACHQAGVENVVATLGTALTREHAMVLRRIASEVVLLFDGDEAGRKAADRAIETLIAEPIDVRICVLPDGMDPDDLLRATDGREIFLARVDASVDALDWVFDRFRERLATADGMAARQRVLESLLDELVRLGIGDADPLRRALLLSRVAALVRLPAGAVETAFAARTRARSGRRVLPEPVGHDAVADAGAPGAGASSADPQPEDAPVDAGPAGRALVLAERAVAACLLAEPALLARTGSAAPEVSRERLARTWADPVSRRIVAALGGSDVLSTHAIIDLLPDSVRGEALRLLIETSRAIDPGDSHAIRARLGRALSDLDRLDGQRRLAEREIALRATEAGSSAAMAGLVELLRSRAEAGAVPAAIARRRRSGPP
ncbi:MAG: DNA primase [Phycisphaeraceae bacterium]|nr:DNA primase [Phycisphaeraceae bacterium]